MKRTILAALSALCLAGAALAEKADYSLTYTTFGTSGVVAVVVANTGSAPTLTLTGAAFARTITVAEGDERPINFNPTALKVTSVTLAFASQTAYSTSFTLNGAAFGNPTVGAAIAVPSSAGDRTVWPVTYTCEGGVRLETGVSYELVGLGQGLGGSQASYFTVDGVLHAEVVGTATLDRHVIDVPVSGTMDLSDALGAGFADTQDTVVVAEFDKAGGTLVMDRTLEKAAFVAGSAATANAAVIQFVEGVAQTGPFTLRDDGEAQGRVILEGPTDAVWAPAAFLLRCDLTLRAPLPASLGAVTIPAGRTVRLELPADAVFPDLRFGDAASRLELASKGTTIPVKYLGNDMGAAGVLALEQEVSANTVTVGGTGRIGTLELNGGYAFSFGTLVLVGEGAAFRQNGGTASVTRLTLNASATTLDVAGGSLTVRTVGGFAPNTNVDLAVGPDGTLTLNQGIAAGNDNSSLEITVAGTLVLGGDLVMTPAARRALTLDGGIIRAASAAEVVNGATGADAESENFMEVTANGGTLAGDLTVDGLRGPNGGTLTLDGASVGTVLDYIGVIRGGKGIGQIAGSLGDVTLGDPWGGDDLGALATEIAADYRGTLGFTAGAGADAQKTIDFASVDGLTALPGAFRINDNQHIIMRLDQYADATIRWPDAPQGVTLTLIESGAYGGTVTLPHIPGLGEGVTLEFASFDASAPGGWASRPPADFDVVSDESGVTDTLTWDDPVFTGEGAWIDVEFDGDTRNTGWFTLTDQDNATVDEDGRTTNGLLCGLPGGTGEGKNPFGDKVMYGSIRGYAAEDYFSEVRHPYNAKGGLALYYRPYVAMKSSLVYPETWSLSVRLSTPEARSRWENDGWVPGSGHRCLIAFGNNDNTGNNPELDNCNALVLATGETDNEIVLYRFSGRRAIDGGAATAQPSEVLFRKTVADATSAAHTVSVVYDGETMAFYLDGAYIDATAPGALEGFRLGRGLQVGAQIGGQGVVPDAFWELAYPPSEAEGGVIDYIRFYKGALTDVAMQEIADRTPYVRENLRYVRKVPAATIPEGGETWIQAGAWLEQTWSGSQWVDGKTFDQPAEGAECRLLVAAGEYVIQVNVERQEGAYFYSPNRCYATLVVAPQEGASAAGTVRLTPLGVTTPETDTAAWEREIVGGKTEQGEVVEPSEWYATTATADAGNRTGFRYGRIRFTGGAGDPINDDPTIANFHGASYLLAGERLVGEGTSQTSERKYGEVTWDGKIEYSFERDSSEIGTATQTGTCTYTYIVTQTSGGTTDVSPTHGIYDAGVCVFSKYANMVVETTGSPITTVTTYQGTATATRTATARRTVEWEFWEGWVPSEPEEPSDSDWSEPSYVASGRGEPIDEKTTSGEVGTVETHLRLVAGASLTRGERDEVVAWQLTGPVRVQGFEANTGDLPFVDGNTDGDPEVDGTQASLDVWVPGFGADASWKFYDVTRKEAEANENGRGAGLFAQGIQTPGRLYLDLTKTNGAGRYDETTDFSQQAWYRYGYEGTSAEATRSGMEPAPISETDFDNAVAFQIRLADGDATLVLDALPEAEIDTFFVEDSLPEGTEEKLPTLFLTGAAPLPIHRSVVAEARLDVSNEGYETMALNLCPEGEPVPVHRGTSAQGALIVGDTTIDWDFGAISSVPRLEVAKGKTLTLEGGQDFRNYGNVLAAQAGATLAQRGASALLGTDVVLGDGAVFAFQAGQASSAENGVELTGALRLLGGEATLRGSNVAGGSGMPHFTALGGVVATNATLVVDAPGASDSWHSHTVALNGEGIGLTKTGAGTVDFYAEAAPTVSGPVRVEEGTLLVAKRDALAYVPIGKHGLHVEKGATLGANARISGDTHFLAHLPSGATLSGGGMVEGGFVRLDPGACYEVKQGEALTATAGFSVTTQSEEATVQVRLPEDYEAGTVFLVAGRREPDQEKGVPNVRRRLLSLKGGTTRWDTTARIENGAVTKYAAQPPAFPVPVNPDTLPEGEHAYHKDVLDALLEHYHGENIAYVGASVGLTQAGTYRLNAAEISDALICFEGIRHYGEASGAAPNDAGATVEYVDGGSFYLAYEFGVAASAFATVGEQDYVVVKVELRNALGASFPELADHEVAAQSAAFRATTEVYLAWKGGDAVKGAEEVTDLTGATLGRAAAEGGLSAVRYFRVPYTEENFPAGEARQLEARARLRPTTTD